MVPVSLTLALLVTVASATKPDEVESALSSDSECTADSDSCAFNALQLHSGKAETLVADMLNITFDVKIAFDYESFLALHEVQTGDCKTASDAVLKSCAIFEKSGENPNYDPTPQDIEELCSGECGSNVQTALTSCQEGEKLEGEDMHKLFEQLTSTCNPCVTGILNTVSHCIEPKLTAAQVCTSTACAKAICVIETCKAGSWLDTAGLNATEFEDLKTNLKLTTADCPCSA